MSVSPSAPLNEVRDWLRERLDDGEKCPCCTQLAKVYRRKIHGTVAKGLIGLYQASVAKGGPFEWVHLSSVDPARVACKAAYWGLLEESDAERDDGGSAGFWRLTPLGLSFVLGETTVPKYARVYDGRCLGLVGDPVGINDCLPVGFDLRELMEGM